MTAENQARFADGDSPCVLEWGAVSLPIGDPSRITEMKLCATLWDAIAEGALCGFDWRVYPLALTPAAAPCDMGEICIGCQPREADGACPYARDAFLDGYETGQADAKVCQVPPLGWRCTRDAGHDGHCAAVEAPDEVALVERGMGRLREQKSL